MCKLHTPLPRMGCNYTSEDFVCWSVRVMHRAHVPARYNPLPGGSDLAHRI